MRPFALLTRLPASLLLLVAAQVENAQADTQRLPTAIRKMSPDAGEKLLHEYYAFGQEEDVVQVGTQAPPAMLAKGVLDLEEEELLAANSSASESYRAPFAPHFDSHLATRNNEHVASGWHLFQRAKNVIAKLEKRQFACPTGTSDCSAIGFPNSCCQAGTERAKCNRDGDRRDADKYPDLDGQRISNNNRGHCHRPSICEHDINNKHQGKLKLKLYGTDLHNSQFDVSELIRDIHWPRCPSSPNLDQHLDHAPRLLPHWFLRLLSRLRWRLLPDWPRLPCDVLPIYGVHHHYLWRRDDSCARNGCLHHHLGGNLCGRLVAVPFKCRPDCRVLPEWLQLRHGELFPSHGQRDGQPGQRAAWQ
ncbi:hypothetical protein Daus18300_002090 [Diaporthe australafricana]|uniref:Uncharacterized protein n=1 Tax=Diaporthe australafricana TaxID=127596 RepID=A0ABR3XR12_9PEZI